VKGGKSGRGEGWDQKGEGKGEGEMLIGKKGEGGGRRGGEGGGRRRVVAVEHRGDLGLDRLEGEVFDYGRLLGVSRGEGGGWGRGVGMDACYHGSCCVE
jgi:hypothetical protein